VKAESIREAENITNIEINKILTGVKNNELKFNEEKSKVMVISRWKKKKTRKFQFIWITRY
jgi:hypothetical protein